MLRCTSCCSTVTLTSKVPTYWEAFFLVLSQVRKVLLLTGRGRLADADRKELESALTQSCNEGRQDSYQVAVRWRATLSTDDFRFCMIDSRSSTELSRTSALPSVAGIPI